MTDHVVRSPESSLFRLLFFIAFTRIVSNNTVTYVAGLIARVSGASDSEMGVINGVFVLTYACAAVFFGTRSDKWGRKRVLLLSYGAAIAVAFVYLFLVPVAPTMPLPTIIGTIVFLRILDGWFLGAFWPPLQGRLCESPGWNDRRLRFYNLSWSVGILVSNALVSAATVVDPVPTILFPVLALLLWISEGILGINVAIIVKVQDIRKDCAPADPGLKFSSDVVTSGKTQNASRNLSPRAQIAIVAMLGYGLLMAAIYTNIFNQFSQVSLMSGSRINLIPWVTVLDNVRFATQLLIFSIAKTPARPKRRFLVLTGCSTLLLVGLAFASEFLLQAGILSFVPLVGLAGLVLGLFYANGFGVIMREARPDNRGYYQGLLETVSNLGYCAGIILSASISGVLGYLTSFETVTICMVGLFVIIALIPATPRPQIETK